jgi:hypothetical protein
MAYVKEVGNGYFFIDVADDKGIKVTDEIRRQANEAFGHEPDISQEELDILFAIPSQVSGMASSDVEPNNTIAVPTGRPQRKEHLRAARHKMPKVVPG